MEEVFSPSKKMRFQLQQITNPHKNNPNQKNEKLEKKKKERKKRKKEKGKMTRKSSLLGTVNNGK